MIDPLLKGLCRNSQFPLNKSVWVVPRGGNRASFIVVKRGFADAWRRFECGARREPRRLFRLLWRFRVNLIQQPISGNIPSSGWRLGRK